MLSCHYKLNFKKKKIWGINSDVNDDDAALNKNNKS